MKSAMTDEGKVPPFLNPIGTCQEVLFKERTLGFNLEIHMRMKGPKSGIIFECGSHSTQLAVFESVPTRKIVPSRQ